MITLTTSLYSKIPGVQDYSSLQAGGSLTVEVAESETSETIKERIKNIYSLLESTIREELQKLKGDSQKTFSSPAPAKLISAPSNGTEESSTPKKSNKTTTIFRKPEASTKKFNKTGSNNDNKNRHDWTQAKSSLNQQRCIYALCKTKKIPDDMLQSLLSSNDVNDTRQLSKAAASSIIKFLKDA